MPQSVLFPKFVNNQLNPKAIGSHNYFFEVTLSNLAQYKTIHFESLDFNNIVLRLHKIYGSTSRVCVTDRWTKEVANVFPTEKFSWLLGIAFVLWGPNVVYNMAMFSTLAVVMSKSKVEIANNSCKTEQWSKFEDMGNINVNTNLPQVAAAMCDIAHRHPSPHTRTHTHTGR